MTSLHLSTTTMPMIREQSNFRLQYFGRKALTNTDLLTLLLNSAETPTLARTLLTHFGSLHNLARASKAQLLRHPNVGETVDGCHTSLRDQLDCFD
ncbi:MAG: hypothetical protein ACPG8W_11090 [Candidatus Promineifilaceae bacterium]